MGLQVYGPPGSRAGRVWWLLRELDLEAESVVPDMFAGELQKPEFLAINPMGQVPVLVDDGFAIAESLAITLYLAAKHGGPIAPAGLRENARAVQWSLWVQTAMEPHFLPIVAHRTGLPAEHRDPSAAAAAEAQLARPLRALDAHLATTRHIAADRFTVADLNVASVLTAPVAAGLDLSPYSFVERWANTAYSRPAAKGVLEPIVFPPPIVAHFLSQMR